MMKSDNIKEELLKKAIYFLPLWLISIIILFISYDVFFIKYYLNNKLINTYFISKYHDDFNEKTDMYEFNYSFTLFQMFSFVFLTLLPTLGYAHMTSKVLRARFVQNLTTILGMTFTITISLFLITSLGLFKFSLKSSLCNDFENGFLNIYNKKESINSSSELTICGDDFNFFKGEMEISKGINKKIKIEWGVNYQWYLILIPIFLSFVMLIMIFALLIRDKYIKESSDKNSFYTALPSDSSFYGDGDEEKVIKDFEKEMDYSSLWGRDDWYDYTQNNYSFTTILISQILYISSIILISIFKFSYYLLPFFGFLFIILGSYYFLLFYGIRDNYLIKILKKEGDIKQFLDKLNKKKPKVAKLSTVFQNNKSTKCIEPKNIIEWYDISNIIDLNSNKPIIEINIDEEFEIIQKPSLNKNETISIPPPVQVKSKTNNNNNNNNNNSNNYLFIKSDLPNYYIYTNNNNRISINRTLHGVIVFLGFSFIYKIIYLNRLIDKKNYLSKTKFR